MGTYHSTKNSGVNFRNFPVDGTGVENDKPVPFAILP